MSSFNAYKQGFLPAPGAWMDQACAWVKGVRLIESEIGVIEEERERLRRARNKQSGS